jgi:hypothetical protein
MFGREISFVRCFLNDVSMTHYLVIALIPHFLSAKENALTTPLKNRRCASIFFRRGAFTI